MCEMVDPYISNSTQGACVAATKTKMTDKTAKEVMKAKYKGPIQVKKYKGQEEIFKAMINLIVRWVLQNHPMI